MSVDAMSWVFKESPYTLGTRLVHLAIADVANDANENKIWLSRKTLAEKAHLSVRQVSRCLQTLIADGYLEEITPGVGREAGQFRFVPEHPKGDKSACLAEDKEDNPSRFDGPKPAKSSRFDQSKRDIRDTQTGHPRHPNGTSAAIAPLTNAIELKEPAGATRRDELWDSVMASCRVSIDRITSSARGGYNRAVADIRAVHGTPDQVPKAAKVFARKYPGLTLTPTALAKHWPQLVTSTNGHGEKRCVRCGGSLERGFQRTENGPVCNAESCVFPAESEAVSG